MDRSYISNISGHGFFGLPCPARLKAMSVAAHAVILPAYVDEAGARGAVRNLAMERDHEFGLMCALLFEPDTHLQAVQKFTPAFNRFVEAMPRDAKLHITDAFKPGNEPWREVAEGVRDEFLQLIQTTRPMLIYAARRLRLARTAHESGENLKAQARAAKPSPVKIVGENRPNDWRIEDDLIISLALRLDAFAEDMAGQVHQVKQVDLLFDEIDVAERYEATIQRTREVSKNITVVKGWDPTQSARVEGAIGFTVNAPFRVDTKFIGGVHVMGKAHPLILAVDIVTNHLAHHLGQLPADAPLSAPSSIAGWVLEDRVWGVMDQASEDLF
jgi:hypothetical protein